MSERGKGGKFLPGNKASPGRPKRFIEQKHLKAQSRNLATLHKQVAPDMVATIVKRAIVDAVHGDSAAREWLSRYVLPPRVGHRRERHAGRADQHPAGRPRRAHRVRRPATGGRRGLGKAGWWRQSRG